MTTLTPTVTDFVLARLDEKAAKADLEENIGHISGADYDRTLAECAAMRKIVELAKVYDSTGLEEVLIRLASIWSDHPQFNPDWS